MYTAAFTLEDNKDENFISSSSDCIDCNIIEKSLSTSKTSDVNQFESDLNALLYLNATIMNEEEISEMSWSSDLSIHFFTSALYIVICIITLFGNILLFITYGRKHSEMTPTKVNIINLVTADLIFIFLCILNNLLDQSWMQNVLLCVFYKLFTDVCFGVFVIIMAFLGVQEYISTRCTEIKSKLFTNIKCTIAIDTIIWVITFIISIPTSNYSKLTKTIHACEVLYPLSKFYLDLISAIDFLYSFIIPLPIIFIFYFLLLNKRNNAESLYLRISSSHREHKSTKTVRMLIIMFFIFYLPNYIYMFILFLNIISRNAVISPTDIEFFVPVIYWFKYIHSSLNPVLILIISRRHRLRGNARNSFASNYYSRRESRMSETSFSLIHENEVFEPFTITMK